MVDHIATRHELTEALGWGEAGIEAAGTAALAPSGGFFSFEEVDPKTGAWTNPHQMQGLGSQFRMILGKPDADGMSFHTWEESYPVSQENVDAFMEEHQDIFNPAIAARVEKRWRAIDALFLDGQGDDPEQLADARDVSFRDYNDYTEADDDGDEDVLEEDEPDDLEDEDDRGHDGAHASEQAFAHVVDLDVVLDAPDFLERAGSAVVPETSLEALEKDPAPRGFASIPRAEDDGSYASPTDSSVESNVRQPPLLRHSLVPLDAAEAAQKDDAPRQVLGSTFVLDLSAMASPLPQHLAQVRTSVEQAQEGDFRGIEPTIQFLREKVAWTRSVSANHLVAMISDDLTKVDLARDKNSMEFISKYTSQRFPDGSQHAGMEFQGKREGFWVALSEDAQHMQIGRYRQGTKEGPWLDVDVAANTVRQQDFHLGFPVRRQPKSQAVVTAGRMER